MKKFIFILLLSFIYSLPGKGAEGVGNGIRGEGVGNIVSRRLFMSSLMAAAYIKFPENLALQRVSESKTRVDNSTLVKGNERVSSVTFEIVPAGQGALGNIASVETLKTELGNKKAWTPIQVAGGSGYFAEVRTATSLQGEYYLLTNNKQLLRVEVNSFASANGIALIAPIVRSFSYDITPPVIHEMKLEGKTQLSPGDKARILVRVTDDLSGVVEMGTNRRAMSSLEPTWIDYEKKARMNLWSDFKRVKGDWFAFDFTIAPDAESGDYYFDGMTVMDFADNIGGAKFHQVPGQEAEYVDYNDPSLRSVRKFSHLSIIKISVINGEKKDRTRPQVRALDVRTKTVKPGQSVKVWVQMDSKSGFGNPISYSNSYSVGFHATIEGISAPKAPEQFSGLYGVLKQGADWVQVEIKIPVGFPSGIYAVNQLMFQDRNRNMTTLKADKDNNVYQFWGSEASTGIPVAKFEVLPDERADQVAPEILEIKTNGVWSVGSQTAELLVHATDSLSGIDPNSWHGGDFNANWAGAPKSAHFAVRNKRIVNRVSKDGTQYGVVSDLLPSPPNWFRYVPGDRPYLPAGEYYLRELRLSDRAGNLVMLEANLKDGLYHRMTYRGNALHDLGATSLPVVKVQLTR